MNEVDEDTQPDNRPQELSFLDLAGTLAKHKKVIPELLRIIQDVQSDAETKQMALYILLQGDDKEQAAKALSTLLETDAKDIVATAISLLDEAQAIEVIKILLEIVTQNSMSVAAGYLLSNKADKIYSFVDEKTSLFFILRKF